MTKLTEERRRYWTRQVIKAGKLTPDVLFPMSADIFKELIHQCQGNVWKARLYLPIVQFGIYREARHQGHSVLLGREYDDVQAEREAAERDQDAHGY